MSLRESVRLQLTLSPCSCLCALGPCTGRTRSGRQITSWCLSLDGWPPPPALFQNTQTHLSGCETQLGGRKKDLLCPLSSYERMQGHTNESNWKKMCKTLSAYETWNTRLGVKTTGGVSGGIRVVRRRRPTALIFYQTVHGNKIMLLKWRGSNCSYEAAESSERILGRRQTKWAWGKRTTK